MKMLVASPYMDDESFGVGGTMLKYAKAGEQVYWLNISNTKPEYGYSQELTDRRERQREQAAEMLGVCEAIDLKWRPSYLASYPEAEAIGKMGEVIRKIEPEILVTAFPGDIHTDHEAVFRWVKAFSKSFRWPSIKRFLLMEVISETDFALGRGFAPNLFVDISRQMEDKLRLLAVYEDELGEPPFPRSLENARAKAASRGAVAGTRYAEAFMILREIEK